MRIINSLTTFFLKNRGSHLFISLIVTYLLKFSLFSPLLFWGKAKFRITYQAHITLATPWIKKRYYPYNKAILLLPCSRPTG